MGNSEYRIDCTGNCVAGDEIYFTRATFTGSYRNAQFAGYEAIEAKIVGDSYSIATGYHWFDLIRLDTGKKFRIRGKNLYANGVARKPWANEGQRAEAIDSKRDRSMSNKQYRQLATI